MNQKTALNIMKSGQSVFLTGQAGTGKTHVLNEYIGFLRSHGIEPAITASTGIAATHIGGSTIHSWSGMGIKNSISEYDLEILQEKQYLWKRMQSTKVLILDEVSMISSEFLDSLDQILKMFLQNQKPFGGIQVIFSGDFFQLPPVQKNSQVIRYAWEAKSWNKLNPTICYLSKQFRQTEHDSLNYILADIRDGEISEESMNYLRGRYKKYPVDNLGTTKLYTHNVDVDAENNKELEKLDGKPHFYEYKTKGSKKLLETLAKGLIVPEVLQLKKNARVMFVKNNYEKGYMNGTTGTVIDFSPAGYPMVAVKKGTVIEASEETWAVEEGGKILASVSQVPLRLAWAITVHKSQGLSLDRAEMDLSRTFTPGQGYVALSRLRELEGLTLLGFNPSALVIDPKVLEYDKDLKRASKEIAHEFDEIPAAKLEKTIEKRLESIGGSKEVVAAKDSGPQELGQTHRETRRLVSDGLTIRKIALTRGLKEETILEHLLLIKKHDPAFDFKNTVPDESLVESVQEAYDQIKKDPDNLLLDGSPKLSAIHSEVDGVLSYADIKWGLLGVKL